MAEPETGATAWSRRYQANLERLRSGERSKISDVVRELSTLEHGIGLTTGERRMLRRAKELLAGPPDGGNGAAMREPRRPRAPSGSDAAACAIPADPEPV